MFEGFVLSPEYDPILRKNRHASVINALNIFILEVWLDDAVAKKNTPAGGMSTVL